jgi:hypothetical protein
LREWLEKRFRDLDRLLQRSRSPFWLTGMKGDETRVRLATLGYDDLLAIVRALEQPRKVRLCLVHIDDLHRAILTKSLDLVNRRCQLDRPLEQECLIQTVQPSRESLSVGSGDAVVEYRLSETLR